MVEVYSLLFSIIGLISIFLYSLMYILRYVYYYFENKTLRRFINRLLPYFSRNNMLFLILALSSFLLHLLGIMI